MTTLIPDLWELPSYLAGDVIPLGGRDRVRATVPDESWAPGQEAKVLNFQRKPAAIPVNHWENTLADIEKYDPEVHGPADPAELYSQRDLDVLHHSGFHPVDSGVWHRKSRSGPTHIVSYNPGLKDSEGKRIPWHVTTDPEQVGSVHSSLSGALGAIKAELRQWGKQAARQSPGQQSADDWLERNSPESFEHDPRSEAQRWMDEHAHEYDEWHPSTGDYTYPDVGDAAGQRWDEQGEAHPTALPGHFQEENEAMGAPRGLNEDMFGDENDDQGESEDHRNLAEHGFEWEEPEDNSHLGRFVKHQHDPEGNHISTHTIHPEGGRWHLNTTLAGDPEGFVHQHSNHGFISDAVDQYRQHASEALLPQRGYEPHRGRTGWITHWSKNTPAPEGSGMEDYNHEINMPEEGGFRGETFNDDMTHRGFAPHGLKFHNSHDLANVVREQDRLSQGMHPGGARDNRISRGELLGDPSVARLGAPSTISDDFWGDGKVGRVSWHVPHPEGHERPVHAEAVYNWDKGGYDFKYTHDGVPLAATHNAVPAGAPVHVPGRQTQLPLGH